MQSRSVMFIGFICIIVLQLTLTIGFCFARVPSGKLRGQALQGASLLMDG